MKQKIKIPHTIISPSQSFQPIELLHLRCFLVPVSPPCNHSQWCPAAIDRLAICPGTARRVLYPPSPSSSALHNGSPRQACPRCWTRPLVPFFLSLKSLCGIREKALRGSEKNKEPRKPSVRGKESNRREEKRRKSFSTEHQSHIFKEGRLACSCDAGRIAVRNIIGSKEDGINTSGKTNPIRRQLPNHPAILPR